jgi:hypothetical protein
VQLARNTERITENITYVLIGIMFGSVRAVAWLQCYSGRSSVILEFFVGSCRNSMAVCWAQNASGSGPHNVQWITESPRK